LVIVGTEDIWTPAANSLMITEKDSWSMACSNKRCWTWIDVSISRTIQQKIIETFLENNTKIL
jgi:hypothetical protein